VLNSNVDGKAFLVEKKLNYVANDVFDNAALLLWMIFYNLLHFLYLYLFLFCGSETMDPGSGILCFW